MRGAFVRALVELAESDNRVMLLTGDLGFMALEPFSDRFPDRFLNVGVAEQNMIGVATGLAEAGLVPYCYSIVPFASLRPFEVIRNGPISHQFPVRVVGVGTGFEYSHNGASHYGIDDAGVMRIQPGITVISPADHLQTRSAVLATADLPGPVYYRLGKDDRVTVPGLDGRFELARCQVVREGRDIAIVAMGSISREAVAAADSLAEQRIDSQVVVISSFNPSPIEDLRIMLERFAVVVTVEAHYVNGGVGSLVAEIIAENGLHCRLVRRGIRGTPDGLTGSQEFLYDVHGLSSVAIADAAISALRLH